MKGPIHPATLHDPAEAAAAWLLRFVEEAPGEAVQAEWRRWLDSAPECRAAYARAYEAWEAMDDTADAPWLDAMAREACADVQRRFLPQRGLRSRGWRVAAACLVLALLLGGAGWWYVAAPVTYATGLGERRTVQLDDGSQVSLDADTRVQVAYSRDHRSLRLLHGRVACEVAKDPLRPFSVRAADKVVVATGTEFSVELVANQVRVVLYEGHVAVLDAGGSASQPQAVRLQGSQTAADTKLAPGRELVMPVHLDAAVVTPINPAQSLSWEHGQLYFDDETLALAVARVNRYSHTRLAIGDTAAAGVRVSGVFTAGDTRAFVSGVTAVFPIRVVDRNGVQTLVSTAH